MGSFNHPTLENTRGQMVCNIVNIIDCSGPGFDIYIYIDDDSLIFIMYSPQFSYDSSASSCYPFAPVAGYIGIAAASGLLFVGR